MLLCHCVSVRLAEQYVKNSQPVVNTGFPLVVFKWVRFHYVGEKLMCWGIYCVLEAASREAAKPWRRIGATGGRTRGVEPPRWKIF